MKQLERRITGTEMEYPPLVAAKEGDEYKSPTNILNHRVLSECLPDEIKRTANGFMSNGSKLYLDQTHYLEYATPEDDSFRGTVANEIAGERIVQDMLQNAKAEGILHGFVLNKRVLSDNNFTWGYHNNYAADANKISITQESLGALAMHISTMNIYAGAGTLLRGLEYPGGIQYAVGQKASRLNSDFDRLSMGTSEPLISLKNESLSGRKFLRVHTTPIDPNISPWATWMRLGTTSIVLRLMENDYSDKIMEETGLESVAPYEFGKNVAKDPTLRYAARGKNGETLRALDIQRKLFQMAQNLILPPQELEIMYEWGRALNDLESDPMLLNDRADWVIKKQIIDRVVDKHDVPLYDDRVTRAVNLYDLLDRERGLGMKLRERGVLKQWMPPEEMIKRASTHAPDTTRAHIRAKFVRKRHSKGTVIDWDAIYRLSWPVRPINISDPYKTYNLRASLLKF